jgi:hypothetical protein
MTGGVLSSVQREEIVMKVKNKRTDKLEQGDVYVGRPSKWGNPFVIGADGTREEVVQKYYNYLLAHPELSGRLVELRGKNLVCWCAPEACHADVLLKLAND